MFMSTPSIYFALQYLVIYPKMLVESSMNSNLNKFFEIKAET